MLASFRAASLAALVYNNSAIDAIWTSLPLPRSSTPIAFVSTRTPEKYSDGRCCPGQKTSLFATDGESIHRIPGHRHTERRVEKGKVSPEAIKSIPPKKRSKKKEANAKKVNPKKGKRRKSKKKSSNAKPKETKRNGIGATATDTTDTGLPSKEARSGDHGSMYIQFSRVFQRHVVYEAARKDNVIQSFEFLDEAVAGYPDARVLAPKDLPFPPPSCSLVYPEEANNDGSISGSSTNDKLLVSRARSIDSDVEEEECETTIAGMGLWTLCELEYDGSSVGAEEYRQEQAHAALRTLLRLVSSRSSFDVVPRHFFRLDHRRFAMRGLTPEKIQMNHFRVVNLLSCGVDGGSVGLAMDPSDVAFVLQNFPQLCMYTCDELEGLARFLLQPLPAPGTIPSVAMVADRGDHTGTKVDWPSLLSKGYGVGLSVSQATKAIRAMPELLALYHEDSRKPSMMYLYNQISVPSKLIDEANIQLKLEGSDPSDTYVFAYLNSIGISWGQLRVLISALPLWTTSALDPGWELVQKGLVRSMLKRPALDYLRQRLQVGPKDVHRMLKTHSRLSTYDACNKILPTMDQIQTKLALSGAELRKLMLRMPSLMGVGKSALDDRLEFFSTEVGMCEGDIRKAIMKQPSLLQYGVDSTLRPKLRFFQEELGLSQSAVGRIVTLAPAALGLSLTDNLRPKVASIMKFSELGPHEVGSIINTSPQILLLSQKGKIEPTLKFLSLALGMAEQRELGKLLSAVPRVLHHGLETSLAKKVEMLTSKEVDAAMILKKNPALLVLPNAVLEERLERCPKDEDISTRLLPSRKGRPKSVAVKPDTKLLGGRPVLASSDASFDSLVKIYPSLENAALGLGVAESAIRNACRNGAPVDGIFLCLLTDYQPSGSQAKDPKASISARHHAKTVIPLSIFCAGGVYPSDSSDVARGRSRTGGLAFQVFTDGSRVDKSQLLQEMSSAASSCFGIRVPIGENNDDGSNFIAVFPLINPSRNRCQLFACSGALRMLEAFLRTKAREGDYDDTFYDVQVFTDSNYAWNLVKSKERLLRMGAHVAPQEMLAHLDAADHTVNIDILHPLARSFSRLNGCKEPAGSSHRTFDIASVEFRHSMDVTPNINGGIGYVKGLKRRARAAAMWQFMRERNFV